MELRRLYMKNFLAVGDEPVEILFNNKGGITLIRGNNQDVSGKSSNGSGKSTIIEAIFFGLTGSTLRKLNLEGILHNKKSGECVVEIEFDDIRIVRTITAKGKGGCKLYVAGAERTTASIKETNKLIDEIVGINFETLSNILIFGQHNIISFLDAGEKEKREIIENLMSLREYNEYEENAREQLKELKSKLKGLADKHGIHSGHLQKQQDILTKQETVLRDYRRLLTVDIGVLDANILSMPDLDQLKEMWRQHEEYVEVKRKLEERLTQLADERNNFQSQYNDAVAEKQKESQNKQPLIDKLNQIKAKSHILEERKRQLWQEMVHPCEAALADAEQKIIINKQDTEKAVAAIKSLEDYDYHIGNVNKMVTKQKKRIEDILDKGLKDNETCPTCYGTVDAKNAHQIIKAIEAEITQFESQAAELSVKKANDEARMAREKLALMGIHDINFELCTGEKLFLQQKLDEAKNSVKEQYFGAKEKLDGMVASAQAEVDNFDVDLNSRHDPAIESKANLKAHAVSFTVKTENALKRLIHVEQPSVAIAEIGKLQAQLEADKKAKAEKEKLLADNPYVEMIATLNGNIFNIETDIASTNTEIKDVETRMPYLEFWVAHMGKEGIKSFVIDQIVPTLNAQIDYWMQLIYQGMITVKFDKYFNVSMINNASKNEMIFGQGSGGERRRIDIAIMLAFRQVMKMSSGKDPNILFFDEVAENLDEEGVYRLYDAMQDIAKTNRLYVITHNPTLLHLLGSAETINVVKKDGAMKVA